MTPAQETNEARKSSSTSEAGTPFGVGAQGPSLAGRTLLVYCLALTLMAAAAAGLTRFDLPPLVLFLAILLLGLPFGAWVLGATLRPVTQVLLAVSDGIASLKDRDLSVRLAVTRSDELGKLVEHYNAVLEVLRQERSALEQREILLETALERSPVAILLVHQSGRIVYANMEARRLFLGGSGLESRDFREILAGCPGALREAVAGGSDSLFSIPHSGETETYHLSQRQFQINRQGHALLLLRRLTAELSREEARIWKQAIRIISHELNNSLAPVSSLVHSAQVVARDREQRHRLPQLFARIEDRVAHLGAFLEGYARFARLPEPRKESTPWGPFLETLRDLYPFRAEIQPADATATFDPAQMEQVLINLLKNAVEASSEEPQIEILVQTIPGEGCRCQVLDRGEGMDEETLANALLPFYSTKAEGGGIGLPLCREVLEGHGGRLRIEKRPGGGTVVSCWLPAA